MYLMKVQVSSYIQSGNVVFDTEENVIQAAKKIQKGFSAVFGFECALRPDEAWRK